MTQMTNTGSILDRGTNTGLSTQHIIKVEGVIVGALQKFSFDQNRPIKSIKEIGTDGMIELIPNGATTFKVSCDRLIFDQLHLPEAFGRSFRFINAQRIPFDIEVHDFSNSTQPTPPAKSGLIQEAALNTAKSSAVMVIKNCWFTRCSMPLQVDDYTILQTAELEAETAFLSANSLTTRRTDFKVATDTTSSIEAAVNRGWRRGTMDIPGILKATGGQ